MILVLRGEIRTRILGHVNVGRPGNLLFRPQGIMHTPMSEGPERLELIALRWRGGTELACLDAPDIRFDQNQRIRRQLDWILDLYPSQDKADGEMLDALTYTVIHEFGRLQNPATGDLAMRIRTYIRNHLDRRMTLDDLAKEADMSKYHFARTFKEITGQTPMGLVNQMRVEAVQELLLQTDLPLEAIAIEVGLADASHLSHMFRRLTGHSPGALRRNESASG